MIAIIDSGGANIASVTFALERCGATATLTTDAEMIASADKVILPGVGAAPVAMAQLQKAGLVDCIRSLTQPVLGICLGMQLLFERSLAVQLSGRPIRLWTWRCSLDRQGARSEQSGL